MYCVHFPWVQAIHPPTYYSCSVCRTTCKSYWYSCPVPNSICFPKLHSNNGSFPKHSFSLNRPPIFNYRGQITSMHVQCWIRSVFLPSLSGLFSQLLLLSNKGSLWRQHHIKGDSFLLIIIILHEYGIWQSKYFPLQTSPKYYESVERAFQKSIAEWIGSLC